MSIHTIDTTDPYAPKLSPSPAAGTMGYAYESAHAALSRRALGDKLRRLARQARAGNAWSRPPMRTVPAWQPSTAYAANAVRANNGNVYVCVTGGTSAASAGPNNAATGSLVTDNTVSWSYFCPLVTTVDPTLAPGNWTASTVYALGAVVLNGANLYACVVAGTSAGSGGPTGTGVTIADNTATWNYYGAYRPNPYLANFPTYSTGAAQPGTLTNSYNPQTAAGLAAMRLKGCAGNGNQSTLWLKSQVFAPASGATPVTQHVAVEFVTDAPAFAFPLSPGNGNVSPVIDGVRYAIQGTDSASGSTLWLTFDFTTMGGRRPRHVRLEALGGLLIPSVYVDAKSQVWAPDATDSVRCVCISDSIFAGSGFGPFVPGNAMSMRIGHELGWDDVWDFSTGGTGYVNRGAGAGVTTESFGFRITEALTRSPDVWLLAGSINDPTSSSATIQAAVLAALQAIRNGGSKAPIVLVGTWSIDDTAFSPSNNATIETAIAAAVTQFADPLGMTVFVPIRNDAAQPWITGTWNNGGNANSVNAPQHVANDGKHPNDGGTAYGGRRVGDGVRSVLLPSLV